MSNLLTWNTTLPCVSDQDLQMDCGLPRAGRCHQTGSQLEVYYKSVVNLPVVKVGK